MSRIMRGFLHAAGLGPALALPALGLLVASSEWARAQSDGADPRALGMGVPLGVTWQAGATAAGALAPADILAEVRREGFYPVGRPALRGQVYALYAVDQDDFDVQLTVDALSGRVLWVTGAVARFGGPGSYGHRSVWQVLHSPAPPIEVPVARNRTGAAAARRISQRRFPLLPRTRPADLHSAPAAQAAPAPPAVAVQPVTTAPAAPVE